LSFTQSYTSTISKGFPGPPEIIPQLGYLLSMNIYGNT